MFFEIIRSMKCFLYSCVGGFSELNSVLYSLNPLSPNLTKWSKTLKQFVGNLPTNCLSVFDHFVKLALRGLKNFNCCIPYWKKKSWHKISSVKKIVVKNFVTAKTIRHFLLTTNFFAWLSENINWIRKH